jgi:GTP pyrophosphokinase
VSRQLNYQPQRSSFDIPRELRDIFCDTDSARLHRAIETARIVADLDVDQESEIAGFLYGLDRVSSQDLNKVVEKFGEVPIQLFESASRVLELSEFQRSPESLRRPVEIEENLRRMLIAMVDDVRVVIITLAGKLQILRNCKDLPVSVQQQHALAARDVFAPLANRLGVWQLKWELEDYSLRYLQPSSYKTLARALEEKRKDRDHYISELVHGLEKSLEELGLDSQVQGRAKHIYSIWKKMQSKGLEFRQLWDLRAVRILVGSVDDCYRALALVHSQWEHFPAEFVDYIATPKDNGYSSIHTVVKGPRGKSVEVQIRTYDMHRESELGLAAHWRYKERVSVSSDIDDKVVWLRQLLEWKQELTVHNSGSALSNDSEGELAPRVESRIYVFTPKGTVMDLPRGATPVDFAYSIHTEVGHRTRGAVVNRKMVPLCHPLETGDRVQIQTIKSGGPSLDWLRDNPAYAITNRARNRISQWFKRKEFDQNVSEGRMLLDRELGRLGYDDLGYEKINQHTHFHKVEDLFSAIGSGDYKVSKALYPFKKPEKESLETITSPRRGKSEKKNTRVSDFIVQGVGNLMTHAANCCNPVPGDRIVGYITMGKGVSIHRKSCVNISNIDDDHRDRLIDVDWGNQQTSAYSISIVVTAYHRSGLLHDITEILKSGKADILKASMDTDDEYVTRINLRLEVDGKIRPNALLQKISSIQNVYDVKRSG